MTAFKMKKKPAKPKKSSHRFMLTLDIEIVETVNDIINAYDEAGITDYNDMIVKVDQWGYDGGMEVDFLYPNHEGYKTAVFSYEKKLKEYDIWLKENKDEIEARKNAVEKKKAHAINQKLIKAKAEIIRLEKMLKNG